MRLFGKIAFTKLIPIALLGQPACYAGTELFPAEYIVLPAGTRLVSIFYFHRELSGFYAEGKRVSDGEIKAQVWAFAYTQYGQTLGMPSSWSITLPYVLAHQTAGVLPFGFGERAEGFADTRLTYNFWPIANIEKSYSLAVSTNITPPTGKYNHKQDLNAGDNRWMLSLQLGWVQKLSENLYWDFTPEIKRYSANTDYVADYKLTQADAYAVTSYLRWQPLPSWEFTGGLQVNRGGAQKINGFDLDNPNNQERYFLAARKMLTPTSFVSARFSQDYKVENGLNIDSDLVLRYGLFF